MMRNEEIIYNYNLDNSYLPLCRKTTKVTNVVPYEGIANIDKLRKEHDSHRYNQKKINRISVTKEMMSKDGKLLRNHQD